MGLIAVVVVLLAAVAVRWLEPTPGPTEADLKAQLAAALPAGQEPPPGEPSTSGQPAGVAEPNDASQSQPGNVAPSPPSTAAPPPSGNVSTRNQQNQQSQSEQARRDTERRRAEQERAPADAAARSDALEVQRRQEQAERAKAAKAEEDARQMAAENQARQQAEDARRAEDAARRQAEDARRAAAEAEARRQADEASRITDIPRGTEVDVALSAPLNSGTVKVEDRFQATTVSDLVVRGRVLVPAGSLMRGVVTSVDPASRTNRTAKMTVAFDQLTVNDRPYPVRGTVTQAITGKGLKGEMGRIGAGAGVGAVIGGLLGGTKGAIAGILAGAGGTIAATEGKQVELPKGQVLRVKLDVEQQ